MKKYIISLLFLSIGICFAPPKKYTFQYFLDSNSKLLQTVTILGIKNLTDVDQSNVNTIQKFEQLSQVCSLKLQPESIILSQFSSEKLFLLGDLISQPGFSTLLPDHLCLDSINLPKKIIGGTVTRASLQSVDMKNHELQGLKFTKVFLQNSIWDFAEVVRVVFQEVSFYKAQLHNACFIEATFQNVDMRDVDIADKIIVKGPTENDYFLFCRGDDREYILNKQEDSNTNGVELFVFQSADGQKCTVSKRDCLYFEKCTIENVKVDEGKNDHLVRAIKKSSTINHNNSNPFLVDQDEKVIDQFSTSLVSYSNSPNCDERLVSQSQQYIETFWKELLQKKSQQTNSLPLNSLHQGKITSQGENNSSNVQNSRQSPNFQSDIANKAAENDLDLVKKPAYRTLFSNWTKWHTLTTCGGIGLWWWMNYKGCDLAANIGTHCLSKIGNVSPSTASLLGSVGKSIGSSTSVIGKYSGLSCLNTTLYKGVNSAIYTGSRFFSSSFGNAGSTILAKR